MNRSRTTRTARMFHLSRCNGMLAALALLLLPLVAVTGAEPGNDNRAPDLGVCQDALQVSAEHQVIFHVYAEGFQIYGWTGGRWALMGPEAVLFADAEGTDAVGIHYAGPTWESVSGSKVIGQVIGRCTVDVNDIDWLLLKSVPNDEPDDKERGIFHRVTRIQRVNTVGGLAPTDDGDFVGEMVSVPYTAEYFFYRAHR
jgi:Protein of unknown function (DUF3455)